MRVYCECRDDCAVVWWLYRGVNGQRVPVGLPGRGRARLEAEGPGTGFTMTTVRKSRPYALVPLYYTNVFTQIDQRMGS